MKTIALIALFVALAVLPLAYAEDGRGLGGALDKGRTPAVMSGAAKKTTEVGSVFEKCRLVRDADAKARCMREVASAKKPEAPLRKCVTASNREECLKELKKEAASDLPFIKQRECALAGDESARLKCLKALGVEKVDASAARAVVAKARQKCGELEGEDKTACLGALKAAAAETYELAPAVKECREKFGDDEEGKAKCLLQFKKAVRSLDIDCSVFESEEAQARCKACAKLADVGRRNACLKDLHSCIATSEGEAAEVAVQNHCVRLLKEDYENDEACKGLETAEEKRACLKEKFSLKPIAGCKDAADVKECLQEHRPAVVRWVKFKLREFIGLVARLDAAGYLSEEQVAEIKQYLEDKKEAFEEAETAEEKKAILEEVREKWKEFKEKLKKRHLEGIKKRVRAMEARLDRLEAIRKKLEAAGYENTPLLDAAIRRGRLLIGAIIDADNLRELRIALHRANIWMKYTHRLMVAIRNRATPPAEPDLEAEVPEEPEPTEAPTPTAASTPAPTETATPTEEPTPTPEITPTPEATATPTPTEEPTPTPTEEPTPTPQANGTG